MLVMSFLESGKKNTRWIEAPVRKSLSMVPGCAVCGRNLERDATGIFALSGKCHECANRVFDEDGPFDELEY